MRTRTFFLSLSLSLLLLTATAYGSESSPTLVDYLTQGTTTVTKAGIARLFSQVIHVQAPDQKTFEGMSAAVGETAAGGGFFYKNVNFKATDYGFTNIIGEMTNRSGSSYKMAFFTVSVYDTHGTLLSTCPIMLQTIAAGQTKSWDASCTDVPKDIRYKIAFENAM
jgi:hypothetical protein